VPDRSVVPALPSLAGISDQNTRAALQAIADFLVVRNGDIGPGTDRFVTVGELGKVGVDNTALLASDGNARADPSSSLPNSLQLQNGARNLAALEDSVRSSAFFTALRTRIERLAQRGAQIKQEQETLQSDFASLARISTRLQAEVGNNLVLLEQLAQVTADLDGHLSAQWSVKMDINGYVSGFGLSSTANNSTPYSEFFIAADKFAVGSPSVPRTFAGGSYAAPSTANVPFIVITTPTTLNGKTVPVGVYMRDAFIQNGSIVTAMIGDLQVDTVAIQNNAVTVPVSANQVGTVTLTNAYQTVISATVTYTSGSVPGNTYINASGYVSAVAGTTYYSLLGRLLINGVAAKEVGISIKGQEMGMALPLADMVTSATLGAGTHTVEFQVRAFDGGGASLSPAPGFINSTILLLGTKK